MDLFGDEPSPGIDDEVDAAAPETPAPPENGHPRTTTECFGHESVEQKLCAMINSGRIPHSIIFNGPEGIGKATMAYRFARYLLKSGPLDTAQDSLFGGPPPQVTSLKISTDDPVFRRVASGGHADFMSIERIYDEAKNRFKAELGIDEIRKAAPFLRMTAAESGWRVVIIDDADTMTRNGQNAILKILEEPPRNSVLILIAHRLGALIPTIRSRARVVNFQPLSNETLRQLVQKQGISGSQLDTLALLSGGSYGKALHYIEQGALETLEKVIASFNAYPRWNWVNLHVLAEDMGRLGRDQSYQAFGEILQWLVGHLATAKARGLPVRSQALQSEAIQSLYRNSSLEQLLKICENLRTHFDRVEFANLDKRQGVLGAFSLIAA